MEKRKWLMEDGSRLRKYCACASVEHEYHVQRDIFFSESLECVVQLTSVISVRVIWQLGLVVNSSFL